MRYRQEYTPINLRRLYQLHIINVAEPHAKEGATSLVPVLTVTNVC